MHAPMIARFPGVLVPGDDRDAFATALDVVPTFLELAGVEAPRTEYQGREIHPMRGRSLLPSMKDSRNVPYADDEPLAFDIFGHGVVIMGPLEGRAPASAVGRRVLVSLRSGGRPGEQYDLAPDHSEILARLVEAYDARARANRVLDEPDDATVYPYRPGHLGDLVPDG